MKTLIRTIIITMVSLYNINIYSTPDYTVKAMNFTYAAPNILDFDIYLSGDIDLKAGQFVFNFNPGIANGGTLSLIKTPGPVPLITDLNRDPFFKGYATGSQLRFISSPIFEFQTISDPTVGKKIRRVRLTTSASSFAGTFTDMNISWDVSSVPPLYRTKVFYRTFDEENEIENVFQANLTGSYIIESMGTPLSLMHGKIFYDLNSNGTKDADELIFSSGILQLTPGSSFSASDNFGNYSFFCGTGSNNVSMTSVPSYYAPVPAVRTATFTGPGQVNTSNDFALTPLGIVNDLRITVINTFRWPRPGFDSRYEIIYRNVGTTIITGTVDMVHDVNFNYLPGSAIPLPASYNSGTRTFTWDYADLKPGEIRKISLAFNLPSTVPLTTPVMTSATIFPVTGDNVVADNNFIMNEIVRGSYDPNDIAVDPAGNITPQQVADEESLTYTIRFQNTGTDEAVNIKVIDTLSQGMNIPSIEMIAASHSYTLRLTEGNIAEWRFSDIMLPDSTTDEPGSHGFIRFRIKPKNTLVLGDEIKSTAYIYFDFNEPVITNTAVTLVKNPQKQLSLYWNNHTLFPVRDTTSIQLRSATAPFEIIDSGKIFPESLVQFYSGLFGIENALAGSSYYVVIKHRNSIETWSSNPVEILTDTAHYDFTSNVSKAYGDNMYDVDGIASFYSGDPDQNGQADLNDLLAVYNDSRYFLPGYNPTDLNGDNVVNLNDLTAQYNFTQLFAKTVRP